MPSEIEYHNLYIDIAKRVAKMSKAKRLKVGAIVVKDHSIISYGYNGTPRGDDNCCEERKTIPIEPNTGAPLPVEYYLDNPNNLVTKDSVVHAELNALLKLVGSTESVKDATMYITHSPCLPCCRLMVQTNGAIREVIYGEEYRDLNGIDYLKSKGILVRKARLDNNPMVCFESTTR